MPSVDKLNSENYLEVLEYISKVQNIDMDTQRKTFQQMQRFNISAPTYFDNEVRVRIYKTDKEIYSIAKERKLKHKFKFTGSEIEYINDNPVLSMNWAFYSRILKESGKDHIIQMYNIDKRIYSQEEVSDLIKGAFRAGIPDYMYIMGIDTFWGWVPNNDPEPIIQKIKDWVNNNDEPNFNGDTELFYAKFRTNVRRILRWKTGKQEMNISAEDFVSNIVSTGTSGSAYDPGGPKITVDVDGRQVHSPNNKFAKSAALSTGEKMSRLFALNKQKANASVKVEFYPKVRMIISADYDTTLKMRFVDQWLTQWLDGLDISTLFMKRKQLLTLWKNFLNIKGVNIPIDQEKFDHRVTKRMVLVCNEEVKSLISDHAINNTELLAVMDAIIYALDGGNIYFRDRTNVVHTFEYKSGVLSGWQWTAFMDSLCNAAELLTAFDLIAEKGIRLNILQLNVQGDDVALKTTTYLMGFAVITAMRSMGFLIHPKKSFISEHHNEYLRKYAYNGEVNGYPARMINNILWLYPGDQYINNQLSRLTTMRDNWIKLHDRMHGATAYIKSCLLKDVKGAKIPDALALPYLATCRSLGGGAVTGRGTNHLISQGQSLRPAVVVHNDPGYTDFRLRFGKLQSREMEQWFVGSLGLPQVVQAEQEGATVQRLHGEMKPLQYQFIPSVEAPQCTRNPKFPANVIFGNSHEFMIEAFPRIDSFTDAASAPKSWIYDYVAGRVKIPAPPIEGMSDEFAALVFAEYAASLVNAMYYKRATTDKWIKLLMYTEFNFSLHYRSAVFDPGRYY